MKWIKENKYPIISAILSVVMAFLFLNITKTKRHKNVINSKVYNSGQTSDYLMKR
tara:strand:- start:766 stop:930 length:165 start_codon:yes stop_codon:yes gene_type:complete